MRLNTSGSESGKCWYHSKIVQHYYTWNVNTHLSLQKDAKTLTDYEGVVLWLLYSYNTWGLPGEEDAEIILEPVTW